MKQLFNGVLCGLLFAAASAVHAQTEITPQWAHIAHATHGDVARDIFVSPQGDSYTFGDITALEGLFDHQGMLLLKLNGQGEEVWRKYIHGATEDWDATAKSVTGDEAGNVYVVYDEYRDVPFNNQRVVAAKFSATGQQLWSFYLTPEVDNNVEQLAAGALVHKDGFLYAAGTSYVTPELFGEYVTNGFVYKINAATGAAGKLEYDSPQYHGDDTLLEAAVDNNGNVYAIGRSKSFMGTGGLFSDYDAVAVKFNAQGTIEWEHRLNGSADDEDFGISIALDAQGNCYTSNQLKKAGTPEKEVVVQKLTPAGTVVWAYNFQGSDTEDLWRQPIEVLPNGTIAMVVSNAAGINTMVLNGTTGAQIWIDSYNRNNAGFANHHRDMVADAQGNIYITGTTKDTAPNGAGLDIVTIKYSSTGDLLWLSNYDHTNYFTFGDDGISLGLDGAGNIYTIGRIYQTGANADYLVLRYGDATMGTVDNTMEADIKVYPNPTPDYVNIALAGGSTIDTVVLYDVNGRIIRNYTGFKNPGNTVSLDVRDVAPGMYLLSVRSPYGIASFKILKK